MRIAIQNPALIVSDSVAPAVGMATVLVARRYLTPAAAADTLLGD